LSVSFQAAISFTITASNVARRNKSRHALLQEEGDPSSTALGQATDDRYSGGDYVSLWRMQPVLQCLRDRLRLFQRSEMACPLNYPKPGPRYLPCQLLVDRYRSTPVLTPANNDCKAVYPAEATTESLVCQKTMHLPDGDRRSEAFGHGSEDVPECTVMGPNGCNIERKSVCQVRIEAADLDGRDRIQIVLLDCRQDALGARAQEREART